jgi:hypothetical protein
MFKYVFPLLFTIIYFLGCSNSSPRFDQGYITGLEQNGIKIDSITIDYAKIKTGDYGYPVLEKISDPSAETPENTLIYFDFASKSREDLNAYYQEIQNEYIKKGIAIDFVYSFGDSLLNIIVKIKKNDGDFEPLDEAVYPYVIIPAPDIACGGTFAKYEMSNAEFLNWISGRFPDHIALSFKTKFDPGAAYRFETTFVFNSTSFTLTTFPLKASMPTANVIGGK